MKITCKKVRFRDHKMAVKALHDAATARNFGNEKRRECRTYQCVACNGWHLTSTPDWSLV